MNHILTKKKYILERPYAFNYVKNYYEANKNNNNK